jgi:hypothetical protein
MAGNHVGTQTPSLRDGDALLTLMVRTNLLLEGLTDSRRAVNQLFGLVSIW